MARIGCPNSFCKGKAHSMHSQIDDIDDNDDDNDADADDVSVM